MQVKTFTGSTSQEILTRIKAEMGTDAVILGNRTFRENGELRYEITAGLERQPVESDGQPSGWSEWHKEWMQIKDQLSILMKSAIRLENLTPRQRVALEYLQREGVSDAVAVDLYKRLMTDPGISILECLCSMVPVKSWGTHDWSQQLHFFVGPYGSGKTTTALRFALYLRKTNPAFKVAFVNCDCMRGNGRLTLRHWAELSNFAYVEAADRQGMNIALDSAREADYIFVDVPGLPRGQTLVQWFADMGVDHRHVARHLMLTPFCDALQTKDFLQRYHSEGNGSIVWTKLDEAICFGNIVNVTSTADLPVSALSYGAELKSSLSPATEPLIWRLIFKRQLPYEVA